jgi:hypothetical protein
MNIMMVKFESTVAGGFPVEVTANIHKAEPDVGIMTDYAEIDAIDTLDGKPASFIDDKITAADTERLEEEAFEARSYD